jgi:hypothetical protein
MAFWTCREAAVSAPHGHDLDEYLMVVQGPTHGSLTASTFQSMLEKSAGSPRSSPWRWTHLRD